MHACMHEYLYVCMYVCTYVCMYVCMYVYIYKICIYCIYVYRHMYPYILNQGSKGGPKFGLLAGSWLVNSRLTVKRGVVTTIIPAT